MPSSTFMGLMVLAILALAWPAFDGELSAPAPARTPAWLAFSENVRARTLEFALSLDGKHIAESRDLSPNRIVVHRVGNGRAAVRILDHRGLAHTLAFSPDGRFLAAGGETPAVSLFDLRNVGAVPGRVFPVPGNATRALAFSPGGRRLAAATDARGAVVIWGLVPDGGRMVLIHGDEAARDLRFSPDGNYLGVAEKNGGTVRVWDLETGRDRPFATHPLGSISSVAFSPDGSMLAGVDDFPGSGFWLWDRKWGRLLSHRSGKCGDRYYRVAFSPDGDMLVTANRAGTIDFWDRAMKRHLGRFGSGAMLPRLEFSADGRIFAVCGVCDRGARLRRLRDVLAACSHGGS